jgi:membrane protein YqaA with SNARE-associated domain
MGMNTERDPITEFEHAIGRRIDSAILVCILAVVVGAMVAPIFGWWIKGLFYRYYALEDDCEQRVKNTMKIVWIGLWMLALISWTFVIACNAYP